MSDGPPAPGPDAAADAALSRVAGGAEGGRTGDPARDHPAWTRGAHYLAQLPVDWDGVRAIDVVAVNMDDDDQEAGVLAKVRHLVGTTVRLDALAEPLAEALPADDHGPFRGEVRAPDEGGTTAEVRVTHVDAAAGEDGEADVQGEPAR